MRSRLRGKWPRTGTRRMATARELPPATLPHGGSEASPPHGAAVGTAERTPMQGDTPERVPLGEGAVGTQSGRVSLRPARRASGDKVLETRVVAPGAGQSEWVTPVPLTAAAVQGGVAGALRGSRLVPRLVALPHREPNLACRRGLAGSLQAPSPFPSLSRPLPPLLRGRLFAPIIRMGKVR